jgi:ABC-type transport system involved in multi-copper enzyme maturation permease subunit
MTIRERGYSHWDGTLKDGRFPWWPITRCGIRLTFKRKFFKFFFFFTLAPALVFLVGIYISERLEDFRFMVRGQVEFLQINPLYFKAYFTNDFLLFMMVMMLVFVGAGLVSDDLKFNSLQLYFSRPLKKKDYLIGKAAVIFFYLFMITLVPGVVFVITKLIFSGSLRFLGDYPWLPFSVIGYSLLVTVVFTLYALFLSSLSKNRRYVGILIFGIYLFSDILFGIFFGIFRDQHFSLLSLKANLQQVGAFLFRQRLPFASEVIFSFLVLFGLIVLAGIVLKKRIKGVEIIK